MWSCRRVLLSSHTEEKVTRYEPRKKWKVHNLNDRTITIRKVTLVNGFVRAKTNGVHVYIFCTPPSAIIEEYDRMLFELMLEASVLSPIVTAGDFKTWFTEWASKVPSNGALIFLEPFLHWTLCWQSVRG